MGRLLDILKKTYADEKQKSEDIMAHTISVQQQAMLQQMSIKQQQDMLQHTVATGITGAAGGGGSYGWVNTTVGTGGALGGVGIGTPVYGGTLGSIGTSLPSNWPPTVAQPTGSIFTIAFTDANGTMWAIPVDNAYVGILTQISLHHQNNPLRAPIHPAKAIQMVDGEFSMDEMEKAEHLIEEMEGLEKHQETAEAPNA